MSTDVVDMEVAAERFRMCLAEAGYPTADVAVVVSHFTGMPTIGWVPSQVPVDVAYRAGKLALEGPHRCQPCFESWRACLPDDHHDDCTGDGWDR